MKIRTRHVDEVVIFDLKGDLTVIEGAAQLRDSVDGVIASGRRKMLFNLRELGHIDSAGIGAIVACFTIVNKKKGILKLLALDAKLSRLLSVMERFEDESEALESFQA